MVLVSQDSCKAIDATHVQFFAIDPKADSGGTFKLLAKTPAINNNYYDYLILFEHENIEIVKHVMVFLANGQFLIPYDAEKSNVIVVDLPDLYKHGMKEIKGD